MSDFNSILGGDPNDDFKYEPPVSALTPFSEVEYIEPKLDFELDPYHFIDWLKAESENDHYLDAPTGQSLLYNYDVAGMCEYSCLYICMLLHGKELEGDLRVVCGSFGFWGHYWMEYTLGDNVYYIDLTLRQFVDEAPKLAISLKSESPTGYNRNFDSEGTSLDDYILSTEAFRFYVNPKEI
jgi:hypothetical protein